MCDAYVYAVNMINAFGDYHVSEALLRQFAQAQFENGDIPALSFGKGIKSLFGGK